MDNIKISFVNGFERGPFSTLNKWDVFYLPTFILLTIPKFLHIPVCFHCYCICILYVSGTHCILENHDLRTEPCNSLCIPRMKINIKGLLRLILTFSYFYSVPETKGFIAIIFKFSMSKGTLFVAAVVLPT
jgi:hypothetical protein